jgi:hypothetical protein
MARLLDNYYTRATVQIDVDDRASTFDLDPAIRSFQECQGSLTFWFEHFNATNGEDTWTCFPVPNDPMLVMHRWAETPAFGTACIVVQFA